MSNRFSLVWTNVGRPDTHRNAGVGDPHRAASSSRRVAITTTCIVTPVSPPDLVVRRFFELMQARDWDAAGNLLSPDLHIGFTATGEQFDGSNFLAMNRAYPEGWSIDVIETIPDGDRVAAQIRVTHGDDVFWCAGFYTIRSGTITDGVEHWVTEHADTPPIWRRPFTT